MENYSNKRILSEECFCFNYYRNTYQDGKKSHCSVKINIQEVEYIDTKKKYYYISYEYDVDKTNILHPFYRDKSMEEHLDGEIIYKNELTDKLTEYLLMDDKILETKTGMTTVTDYRINIMRMISNLWD